MKKVVKIYPAILVKNKASFTKDWKKIAKHFKYVQIDIMDGSFVKNKSSLNPQSIKSITRNHKLEIHLMVKDVASYTMPWLKLKNVVKIIWHYEADKDKEAILCLNKYIKQQGVKTGLAINPKTSLSKIKDIIKYFDTIQIMSVTPGKQGSQFKTNALDKIKGLHRKYPKLNIAVDGAVNEKTIKKIKKAGANYIGVGSYLQQAKNIKQAINKLKTA